MHPTALLRALVGTSTLAAGVVGAGIRPAPPPERIVLITDATVIDGTGAPARPGTSVLLRGGRIAAVGPRDAMNVPRAATIVDGSGKYLLPGFIDSHAHVPFGPVRMDSGRMTFVYDDAASLAMARALLAFGVTTIRNPAGELARNRAFAAASASRRGPRVIASGEIIDAVPTALSVAAATPEAARAEVRRQVAGGARFIKLYNWLPPATVAAAVDEAHRAGVTVTGHLMQTNWREAAEAGIDALEHITPLSASLIEPERRADFTREMLRSPTGFMLEWFNHADFDGPLLRETVAALARHQVIVTPTLVTFDAMVRGMDPQLQHGRDAGLIPAGIREGYASFTFTSGWSPAQFQKARRAWPRAQEWLRRLHRAGVPLAIGTDVPMPWVPAGASVHEEMRLFAEAGIPAMDILVAATRTGARLAGVDSIVGTIEVGKRADLVLLDADPLADIRNTRRIAAILKDGAFVDVSPLAAPEPAVPAAADRQAVTQLLDRMVAAVREQDGALMLSAYVLEPPIEFSSHGMLITSRDSLAAIYGSWGTVESRGTYAEFTDVRMRALGEGAVMVTARLALARGTPTGTAPDTMRGGWSGLFERRAGRWGLSHEHESFTFPPRRP